MFSVPVETVDGTYHVTQFRSTVDPVGSHSLTAGVQLVDLINQMIQPSSWSDVGHGPGSCEIMGTQLIVRQTQSVHDELAAFLNQLMKSLEGTEAEDTRVVMVSVDPARDTVEQLAGYVPFFNPEFTSVK